MRVTTRWGNSLLGKTKEGFWTAKGDTGTGRVEDSSPNGANPVGVTGIDGPCVPTQKRPNNGI